MSNSSVTSDAVSGGTTWLEIEQAGLGRLCLIGELDMAGAPEVRALVASMTGDVEFDCSALTFLDASGLRVLVAAHRDCQARDAMLTIVNPSPCVVWLLALTGLDSVLGGRAESSVR